MSNHIMRNLSLFACTLFFFSQSFSQGIPILDSCDELVCNGDLQISLNVACMLQLTPDQLLEAPAEGNYSISIFDEHGDFLRDDFLLAEDAGSTVRYQISCDGNSCWGEIIVEANIIPQLDSPCAATEDGTIPVECELLCGPEDKIPAGLVSPEEATAAFGNCGPDLVGDLRVSRTVEGDICEGGAVVNIIYTGKVELHGAIQTVEVLHQRYVTRKLDIESTDFFLPRDLVQTDNLDLTLELSLIHI